MAIAEKNLHVSDDLLAELATRAAAEGKTVDDVAEESLRKSMREQSWQWMLARGKKYGEASGITEDQVPDVVREWRNERRGR